MKKPAQTAKQRETRPTRLIRSILAEAFSVFRSRANLTNLQPPAPHPPKFRFRSRLCNPSTGPRSGYGVKISGQVVELCGYVDSGHGRAVPRCGGHRL